jgi:hypothetical protein
MAENCTVLGGTQVNPNFLQPNKFQLNFSRIPSVQYFCQSVSVPGISTSEAIMTNPLVDVYAPGEKAIYYLFNITFYVDEEMKAWKEIHDWIRAMTFPKEYNEYNQLPNLNKYTRARSNNLPQYSDGQITLLTSANNPNIRFKFYDLFPVSVSTFIMSTTDTPDNPITADATFRYSYYDIETFS